jgi:hypothetical protein
MVTLEDLYEEPKIDTSGKKPSKVINLRFLTKENGEMINMSK